MIVKIFNNEETRANVLEGAKLLYEAVKTTLGPQGQNVIVKNKFGEFSVTHDGVTVAKAIRLDDDPRSLGVDLLKDASLKMEEIGDGTTSVTVLAYHLILECSKLDLNPMDIKRRLEKMIDVLCAEVDKRSTKVEEGDIENVAKISVGGDPVLAKLIADTMKKAGVDSLIAVEKTSGSETTADVAEGYAFDHGFLSHYMINEPETRSVILEKPTIAYVWGGINEVADMEAILRGVAETGARDMLFIVESITDEALGMITLNTLRKTLRAAVVKAPANGQDGRDRVFDLISLTGGGLIDTEVEGWETFLVAQNFGHAKRAVVKANDTAIIAPQTEDSEKRILDLKDTKATDDMHGARITQRLAALTGGVGVIRVGGVNDSEIDEKKYRIDDAIGAVRAALEGGIVAGGGVTLRDLGMNSDLEDDFNARVCDAMVTPYETLLDNAGYETDLSEPNGVGIDVSTGEEVYVAEVGIIDPAIITKEVIRNAFTVAGLALTVGASIVDTKISDDQLMKMMEAGK